jgi:phage tail-like protein
VTLVVPDSSGVPEASRERSPSRVEAGGQLRARRPEDWMLRQLPVSMLSEDFFTRFVSIFQELGTRLLEDADAIEHVPDPAVAPVTSLPWLGSWIGISTLDPAMPEDQQRRIVRGAAATMMWRGTAYGLGAYLELLSNGPAEVSEGGGIWRAGEAPPNPAWVRMRVESTGLFAEAEFVEVVADEVPAHVSAELYVGDRRVWSTDDEEGS